MTHRQTLRGGNAAWLAALGGICGLILAACGFAEDEPRFGFVTAADGDWLAVAGTNFEGDEEPVWLYHYNEGGHDFVRTFERRPARVKRGFGSHLAVTEGTLAISCELDRVQRVEAAGSVDLYELQDGDVSVDPVRLFASKPEVYSTFGYTLAVHRDVLAVGVSNEQAANGQGTVHLFERDGMKWHRKTVVTSPLEKLPFARYRGFGTSIALTEAMLVVGAPLVDEGEMRVGAVFLYEKGPDGSYETAPVRLGREAGSGISFLGMDVAAKQDLIVASALTAKEGEEPETGAVCIYPRGENGTFPSVPAVVLSGPEGETFGESLALWQGWIVVSNPEAMDGKGMVTIYEPANGGRGWQPRTVLTGEEPGAQFGRSLCTSGDRLYVGAPYTWDNSGKGRVLVYGVSDDAEGGLELLETLRLPRDTR